MQLKYMANKRSHRIRRGGERTNYKVSVFRGSMAGTRDTRSYTRSGRNRPVSETNYEYVFNSSVQVLQKAYNKGYTSLGSTDRRGSRGRRIRFILSRKKAQLPLYSRGGWDTCRSKGFSCPKWLRARGVGRSLVSTIYEPSLSCPGFCRYALVWSSGSCSPRQGMARHGGIVPGVAALCAWRFFTNSPVWHGRVVDVVVFILASVTSG